jgi:hypothetical protein
VKTFVYLRKPPCSLHFGLGKRRFRTGDNFGDVGFRQVIAGYEAPQVTSANIKTSFRMALTIIAVS